MVNLLDLVSYQVEIDVELGSDPVLHRYLDGVLLLVGHGGELQGGVDDAGDAQVQQTLAGHCATCCQVQLVCELTGMGPVVFLTATVSAGHNQDTIDGGDSAEEDNTEDSLEEDSLNTNSVSLHSFVLD